MFETCLLMANTYQGPNSKLYNTEFDIASRDFKKWYLGKNEVVPDA